MTVVFAARSPSEDDGDHGDDAGTGADVHQAEHPAQQAVPEGKFAVVQPHHAEAKGGFADALPVKEIFAYQVVKAQQGNQ